MAGLEIGTPAEGEALSSGRFDFPKQGSRYEVPTGHAVEVYLNLGAFLSSQATRERREVLRSLAECKQRVLAGRLQRTLVRDRLRY